MYVPNQHHQSSTSSDSVIVVGETTFRNEGKRFGLLPEDRLRHLWIIGKTGSGKSTLLENLLAQDLAHGRGFALLDPHGDLATKTLAKVPPSRTNEVLLFAPHDTEYPVSFNVFRQGRQQHPSPALLTSQLISIFRKQWSDSWGPRLEHILRNAILAIAPSPQATLLYLYRFLTEESLRDKIVEDLQDPVVKQFWTKEFSQYKSSLQGEALSPVLNKLGAFVSQPIVRNIISQERSRVSMTEIVAHQGILLADLSVGLIGEDSSNLLGGLLLSAIQLAVMQRASSSPPFFVYIDEFQNFVSDSLPTLLSEARKFGLGLVLAHQYLSQLPESVQDAVLGNVGSRIAFTVGAQDAQRLALDFEPWFSARDLQELGRYHIAIRLTVQGKGLDPFSAKTLHPHGSSVPDINRIESIREQSRQRFCQPRTAVEASIARTLES